MASPVHASASTREKLLDIERAKGLGILLVVYGHLVANGTFGIQPWFATSVQAVYYFHMPFFMYLSGFVFYYTGAHLALERRFGAYVLQRLDRLMIPFIAVALLIILSKSLAAQYATIDDPVTSVGDALIKVLTNGQPNPAVSIWYLAVLFVYSIATPFLWRLIGGRLTVLLALAFCIHFLPLPQDFYLVRISRFYVFFVLGMAVCAHRDRAREIFARYFPFFAAAFALALVIGDGQPFPLLVCGLLSIPVLHQIVSFAFFRDDTVLRTIGENSMTIYLFNTLAIGFVKAVYVKVLPYEGPFFLVMILVLMIAGVALPMLGKALVKAIPVLSPVYRYIR